MSPSLAGRHVLVTGATGGLGPAVLEALVAAGAVCHVPHRGSEAPVRLRSSSVVRPIPDTDLTSESAVTRAYAHLGELWGSVHLAGGFAMSGIVETGLVDLRQQLDINLTTAFLCCREAVRRMRAHGQGGRIVNVGSRAALEPAGGKIAYTLAKAGVVALTRALADEVKGDGILVNAVIPSTIDTPTNRQAMPAADRAPWSSPDDIAEAIRWLVSPENRLVSGALLPV